MNIKGPLAYIPVGLWLNCSNETGFISLEDELDGPPMVALKWRSEFIIKQVSCCTNKALTISTCSQRFRPATEQNYQHQTMNTQGTE